MRWHDARAAEVIYRDVEGRVGQRLLFRHDEPELALADGDRPWTFDDAGGAFRLAAEHRDTLGGGELPDVEVHGVRFEEE